MSRARPMFPLCLAALGAALPAFGQDGVAQPAHEAAAAKENPTPAAVEPTRQRSWEVPALNTTLVRAARPLAEEELIGDYAQPRWTARRRFPTTRLYVVPAGTVQLEWWYEVKTPFDSPADSRIRSQYELELGLGHRLQLDLYLQARQSGVQGPLFLEEEKAELRYALADWGKLWGNPTLYLEYVHTNSGPPRAELKLLVGGEAAPSWHWGANAVFERDLGGSALTHEYALTGGVAYTVTDQALSVGAEVKVESVDDRTARLDFRNYEVQAGPSVQWRPVPNVHVDLVALFGFEVEGGGAPAAVSQPLLVVGCEL